MIAIAIAAPSTAELARAPMARQLHLGYLSRFVATRASNRNSKAMAGALEKRVCLLAGSAHPEFARQLAAELDIEPTTTTVEHFSDGETHVAIEGDVRGKFACIVQPTCPPVNDHLIELALMIDAAHAAGAARTIAVVPYFGYARQERRGKIGHCLSAQVAAKLLAAVGLDYLITFDLHAPALESALAMPLIELMAEDVMIPKIQTWQLNTMVVVAPDAGGLKRAQRYGTRLCCPMAVAAKQRPRADEASTLCILGEVEGRDCVLVDDMVSTGGTLLGAAASLRQAGARKIYAVFTHPVMNAETTERISQSPLERIVTTNSIPLSPHPRIEVLSVVPILADALRQFIVGRS
jgi:ribose-phosphate pyrophosphokinase